MIIKGRIIKVIGGLYYVETADECIQCKARGVFRKNGIKPFVGDFVTVEDGGETPTVISVEPRKNCMQRPPVANIDKLVIVVSSVFPTPNTLIIDRLTVSAIYNNIEPIVVFSKNDLADVSKYVEIYQRAGFNSFGFSSATKDGIEKFNQVFENSVCVLTGNSGVGKSTLLNALCPNLALETGDISAKLGRGRHTTRCIELFKTLGGYVADTPGFSSMDLINGEYIPKEALEECFPEFAELKNNCMFTGCSHTVEKGCAVLNALESLKIAESRHLSYKTMYNEVKDIKAWQLKKNK